MKKRLLFVDTNIWLDFYRAHTDAGLKLLKHVEELSDSIIITYQLEMEFKKNRQNVILKGIAELKPPPAISRPGLFSDAKAATTIKKSQERIATRLKHLTSRFERALSKPTTHDPVYQICQRIFHRRDPLVLDRENKQRRLIRNKALRRFLLGCPPRKAGDTSMGDAFNWEWMMVCAKANNSDLVIVSRDSDYGSTHHGVTYINDHLKQEFAERVNAKKKIKLCSKLSDALREFKVQVTENEVKEEEAIVTRAGEEPLAANNSLRNARVVVGRPSDHPLVKLIIDTLVANQLSGQPQSKDEAPKDAP